MIDKAAQQVKKRTTLIDDLLDITKIQAGKLPLTTRVTHIRDIIDDSIELIVHAHPQHKFKFQSDIDALNIESQCAKERTSTCKFIN